MLRAVIFDVDGTLVDSVDLHARSWCEAFAHFGIAIPFAEMRSQIGKGADQFIPHFLNEADRRRLGPELEEFRGRLFKEAYLSKVTGFPGVRELFTRLQADGIETVLASSAKGDELQAYKKAANIEDLVQEETSKDDAERSKPHPDIFVAALEKLDGIAPEETLVVGDTPYDAIAAHRAGVRSIGVLCGGFPGTDLEEAGMHALYEDPSELLTRYDEWTKLG